MVPLYGIAPTRDCIHFLFPGAGIIPIIFTKGKNKIKKEIVRKNLSYMHTKRFVYQEALIRGVTKCKILLVID